MLCHRARLSNVKSILQCGLKAGVLARPALERNFYDYDAMVALKSPHALLDYKVWITSNGVIITRERVDPGYARSIFEWAEGGRQIPLRPSAREPPHQPLRGGHRHWKAPARIGFAPLHGAATGGSGSGNRFRPFGGLATFGEAETERAGVEGWLGQAASHCQRCGKFCASGQVGGVGCRC